VCVCVACGVVVCGGVTRVCVCVGGRVCVCTCVRVQRQVVWYACVCVVATKPA